MTWKITKVWANNEPIPIDILRIRNEEGERILEAIGRENRKRCIIIPKVIKHIKFKTNVGEIFDEAK